MNVRAIFDAMPVMQELRAKDNFNATVAVSLRDWDQVHAASWWCERHWQCSRRQYRRRVNSDKQSAVFEFPHADEAMEFHLKYGSTARNC
jgi:hypothetical protein